MHFIANTLNHCHTTEALPRLKALTYIRQGISAGFSARWKRLLLDGGPKAGAKVTFGDQKAKKASNERKNFRNSLLRKLSRLDSVVDFQSSGVSRGSPKTPTENRT